MKKIGILGIVILVFGVLLFLWNIQLGLPYVGYVKPLFVGDIYIILAVVLIIVGAVTTWLGFRKKK